jgi:drug/metabolite transporter (DMT)-like permease
MNPNRPLFAWSILLLLALVWGSSFILIKKALVAFDPFEVGGLRMVIAGAALLPFALRSFRNVRKEEWKYILLVGLLGNGIPAVLFPLAETVINSATAGILNVLTPLFTLLIGIFFFSLTFSRRKLLGVILGFAGTAVLILLGGQEISIGKNILYSLLVVLAALLYGTSVNIIKKHLQDTNTVVITALALISVAIPYGIFLLLHGTPQTLFLADGAWLALGYIAILGVFGTSLALILFNRLVQVTDPVISSSVTYLIPVVAVAWGLADGESLGWAEVGGMAIILLGVWLVNKK